ncbi:hypothetical protein ASPFODRAFT_137603 [Aspergillus luchuensis CBS 106.47]|uniref:Fungal-type protein kinase domain-containing protein n=1 Tax=Aspergillus luchuensis (strain CBS 106.47) TaxID=1137211 RepID=A0A1M3TEI3_ASPLC|nr:hypothetical protein ASPFODRAFT_137603 [Aspergillus luchuensis CBS 106.47]GAA86598.1 hypothetical protein AKAW_04712 [Aspergillus luchuensis IFO 4308]
MPVLRYQEDLNYIPPSDTPTTRNRKRKLRGSIPWLDTGNQEVPRGKYYASDEAIVNAALLLFLQAVTGLSGNHDVKWTIERVSFKLDFTNARFTTITDGAMVTKNSGKTRGLCEVKRKQLGHTDQSAATVSKQETAELVGLIKNNGSTVFLNGHHHLTSQYANEIYLLFAKAQVSYHEYLKKGAIGNDDFLVIQRCGPWRVNDPACMEQLAVIILAIVLLADKARFVS